MKLRNWQVQCINSAISKFTNIEDSESFNKHFLTLATPGSGKTIMASVLSLKLYEQGLIDLVLCFSPSSVVSSDFRDELTSQFQCEFNGKVGSLGEVFTYQKLGTISSDTWKLFDRFRVFVIFDEIHHCAGSSMEDANAWGAPIIDIIRKKAAYSIALTGTPWRSDCLPIALSTYSEEQKIQCDFIYGLKQAIADNVCRIPQVIAVDNNKIVVSETDKQRVFSSFCTLLSARASSYSNIVQNRTVNEQVISRAIKKLSQLRRINFNAGGLVVASSIEHAEEIKSLMLHSYGKDAVIVTTNEARPTDKIKVFKNSSEEWLISVGMVSEGTNIPRLQVCCNLTNVTTEMYFRQIFGRVLRKTNSPNQDAFMFMPAEPKLIEYAKRMVQDIPDDLARVKVVKMNEPIRTESVDENSTGCKDVACSGNNNGNDKQTTIDSVIKDPKQLPLTILLEMNEELASKNLIWSNSSKLVSYSKTPKFKPQRVLGIVGKYREEFLQLADLEPFMISESTKNELALINANATKELTLGK